MIKIGDWVAPFNRMLQTGRVVKFIEKSVNMHLTGGSSGKTRWVVVEFDKKDENGNVVQKTYRIGDLMRLE